MALKGKTIEKTPLYEGVMTAKVVAVQPTEVQIAKLTNGALNVPASPHKKVQKDDDGNEYTQVRVRFLLEMHPDHNPALDDVVYTLADFYISDRDTYRTKNGGYWIGTSAGQTGYCVPSDGSEETALKEVLESDKRSFVTDNIKSTVILKDGEMPLFVFLSKLFNIDPRSEDVDVNYKELFFADVVNDVDDFAALQEELDEREPMVRVTAYVDDRGYQKVDVRSTLNTVFATTDAGYADRLDKYIKSQAEKGYHAIRDAKNEVVIQRKFDPDALVETTNDISGAEEALEGAV